MIKVNKRKLLNKLKSRTASIRSSLRNLTLSFKKVAVVAIVAFTAYNAPNWHLRYMENRAGQVTIKVLKNEQGTSGGTGFHVKSLSGDVYIMTNAHVCQLSADGEFIFVQLKGSTRVMKRKIVEVYAEHDLCLVQALPGVRGLSVASSVSKGESMRAVGHPLLKSLRSSLGQYLDDVNIDVAVEIFGTKESCNNLKGQFAVAMGFVPVCIKTYSAIETNIVAYPGSSGSPVINIWGNLVAVLFAGDGTTNYAYLVPLSYVKDLLSVY